MREIRVNDFNGFMSSANVILEVTDSEFENMYINQYGVEFLQHNEMLYMRYYGDSFERVRSDKQIEKAFNPDRFLFEKWRHEYGN